MTDIAVRMNQKLVLVKIESEAVTIKQFLKVFKQICRILGYREETIVKAFRRKEGVTNDIQRNKQTNRCPV